MFTDERRETDGFEADRLLRTVCRAFHPDICSIVLDVILRNHYQTSDEDIIRVCKGIPPTDIRQSLKDLVSAGILTVNRRPHMSVALAIPQEHRPRQTRFYKFERFNYKNQQMQLSEEQENEQRRQNKQKLFYFVDYHEAVEVIRYRLYSLLNEKAAPDVFSRCIKCQKQYNEDEYWRRCMRSDMSSVCPECGGRVAVGKAGGVKEDEDVALKAKFQRALQPLIDLLNIVMKKSFAPFKEYSPEEEKLVEERGNEERKRTNAGAVEEVVNIEETLQPCPGALAKSVRVRNGAIPWLAPSAFFNKDGTPCLRTKRGRSHDTGVLAPASKRPRQDELSDDDDDGDEEKKQSADDLPDEVVDAIREMQDFDKQLHDALEKIDALPNQAEMDDVPDTVSVRSGSTSSSEEQEVYSDMDAASVITSPPQESHSKQAVGQTNDMLSRRVCCGFDEDVLAPHVVTVGGELRRLDTLTFCDVNRMTDAEYVAYARVVAAVAGIS